MVPHSTIYDKNILYLDLWSTSHCISGLYNTFQKLLPPKLASKSYYTQICKDLKPGDGFLTPSSGSPFICLQLPHSLYYSHCKLSIWSVGLLNRHFRCRRDECFPRPQRLGGGAWGKEAELLGLHHQQHWPGRPGLLQHGPGPGDNTLCKLECFAVKPKKWTEHSVFNWPSLQALDADVPLIFISFPSVKDPEWTNHPGEHLLSSSLANYTLTCKGRENKTTCAIVTLANWKWFSQWQDGQVTACHDVTLLLSHSCVCDQVKKRGDDYEEIKQAIGHKMIEQTCKLYPQVLTKEASVIS